MRVTKKTFLLSAIAILLSPALSIAASTNPQDSSNNYNIMLITLVGLIFILLFVIGMLASTMKQLGYVVRDKVRKERQEAKNLVKTIIVFLALILSGFNTFAADKVEALAAPVSNMIQGIPEMDFYIIAGVILLELLVIFSQVIHVNVLMKAIKSKPELVSQAEVIVRKSWFWDKFNAAAPIEKEKDVLLDHNYDGIQELDNSLPPWWKYGFYLTIVVACIYLYRFHVSHDGPSQQDEYLAEMQKGEDDKAAYLAKAANNIDETNVVALTGAGELTAGKELFIKTCAACHLADGGGSVGPNLTDAYWLHGGSVKDVFKSIKYGWQDKGMKSWKDDFSPMDMKLLASYVKSLNGTHPATPKAQQGELYIEATPAGNATDSTKAKADTTDKKHVAAIK